jgi:hypothetical protein
MLADEIRTRRYELRPDVVATVLEDGALLLDLESKYFYRLNESGWAIVQLFENGATVDDVLLHCHACGSPLADDESILAVFQMLVADQLVARSVIAANGPPHSAVSLPQWARPTIEKQAEPLQKVIISAFDPSVPLVE